MGRLVAGLKSKYPGLEYNQERNEVSNMTPDMIAQLLLFTAATGNEK